MDVDDEASAYAPRAVLDTGDLIGEQEPSVDDFPSGPAGQESTCNAGAIGNVGLIPGLEDPLEEGMAANFSILAWRIPWTEEPGGLQSMGS